MAKTLSQVAVSTDTFLAFVQKTNYAINAISTECLTANTDANGASTTGNSVLNGIFSANTIAVTELRGGNVQSSAALNVSSNVNFTGSQINVSANINLSGSNVYFSGTLTSVANVTIKSNSTFDVLKLLANSTVKTFTANLDTATFNSNVVISKNVSSIDTLSANNLIASNTLTTVNLSVSNLVSNTLSINAIRMEYETINTTGTSVQLIGSYPVEYSTGKVVLSMKDLNANSIQSGEFLILYDGGTIYMTEYAILTSNAVLGSFSANANATVVRIYATPTVANTTVKLTKTLM